MLLLALFVLGNLAGAFFCSLSEAAMLATSDARIRARMEHGDRRMARLLHLKCDIRGTLAAIVLLNNIFAVGGTAAITAMGTQILPEALAGWGISATAAVGLLIALQTMLIICFAEVLPKIMAEAQPERIAGFVAPTVVWTRRVLRPLLWLLDIMVGWARPSRRAPEGEEAEIRELARMGHEGGHIQPDEAAMIRRVFRLDDITAQDVMTPRPLVQAFDAASTVGQIRDELFAAHHHQFPVYERDLDHVCGILNVHEALAALVRGEDERPVGDLRQPALFLPTSRTVDELLRDPQVRRGRLAVVIDEYGVTEGIVTEDDLMEELIGEAIDETELSVGLVKRLSRDAALVHGLTRVRDIARFLNCMVAYQSHTDGTTTVTGLLHERLERIPKTGDRVEVGETLSLEVQEADERTALRVLARRHDAAYP